MINFTEEQQQAINYDKGNIVVSASAGSGKTSVMVERIIRLVSEGATDVTKILCVTFTKIAAEEIKNKIAKALIKKIKENPNSKLEEQMQLLKIADISTVDSFCTNILRKYFYTIDLDPTFSILDSGDSEALKNKVIDSLFERLFEDADQDFQTLIKAFLKNRSEKNLKELVLNVYEFCESEKEPIEFLDKSVQNYTVNGIEKTEKQILEFLREKYKGLLLEYEEAYNNCLAIDEKYAKYFCERVEYCKSIIDSQNIEELSIRANCSFHNNKNKKNEELYNIEVCLQKGIDSLKEDCKNLYKLSLTVEKERAEDNHNIALLFTNLVKEFSKEYEAMKRDLNVLDFADLGKLTYQILKQKEIADEIAGCYDYIFVDEYQDTNGVQEAIFSSIERNNLFIVGDVKQSIYAFRGCDCDIFQNRLDKCDGINSFRVDLNDNFRSADNVIDSVNSVFSGVMVKSVSKVDYKDAKMSGGSLYGSYDGEAKKIVCEKTKKELDKTKNEVYSVIKHINELKQDSSLVEKNVADLIENEVGKRIFDPFNKQKHNFLLKCKCINLKITTNKTTYFKYSSNLVYQERRSLTFKDFAILTRANAGILDSLVEELISRGIPVNANTKRSIAEYPEIKVICSIIDYICDSNNDIAFATILKSPIGNFSNEELALIRKTQTDGSFCEVANILSNGNGIFAERLKDVFNYFAKIKLLSEVESAANIIERIMVERKFEVRILASKMGNIKFNRIRRFIDAIVSGNVSIYDLKSKLDGILKELSISEINGENAVNILTCHKSKGLEYPVVILAELKKAFNNRKERDSEICMDRDLGIGFTYKDLDNKLKDTTLQREFIRIKRKYDTIADEMRLFYVAMTRAKVKLFLVVEGKSAKTHDFAQIISASKMSDLVSEEDMDEYICSSVNNKTDKIARRIDLNNYDKNAYEKIKKYINYSYPYNEAVNLRLKRTVTQIASQQEANTYVENNLPLDDLLTEDYSSLQDEKVIAVENVFEETVKNNLQSSKSISFQSIDDAAKKGTAFHKFLELVDFNKPASEELERLYNSKTITIEEYNFIKKENYEKVLALDIFKNLNGYKLYKEQPFIVNIPSEMLGVGGEDNVLLQGVIDLLAVKDDKAIIIDYKRSTHNNTSLKERYQKQIDLYQYAVEKVLKKTVTNKYLINLLSAEIVSV